MDLLIYWEVALQSEIPSPKLSIESENAMPSRLETNKQQPFRLIKAYATPSMQRRQRNHISHEVLKQKIACTKIHESGTMISG
eukprot:3508732-Amphidinium_carterae.2